jgi:hypothetical protein
MQSSAQRPSGDAMRAFQEAIDLITKLWTSLFVFKRTKDSVPVDSAFLYLRALVETRQSAAESFFDSILRLLHVLLVVC